MSDWKVKLQQAKELLDMGLIEKAEYDVVKAEVLRAIGVSGGGLFNPSATVDPLAGATGIGGVPPSSSMDTLAGATSMNSVSVFPDVLAGQTGVFVPSGEMIGQYKILGELGKGGMGSVYRARHSNEEFAQHTGDVAIKVMNVGLSKDSTFRTRFMAEAGLGRSIRHPNFVAIHDVLVEDNRVALVMDLVEGRPLSKIINKKAMDLSTALPIILGLCVALDYLHSKGIVHRDLKPDNIIITPNGSPVILDMGIAKSNNSKVTRTNTSMGTLLYMAPEQGNAKDVTASADRYALGLIVYEMLSGRLPWDSGSGEWHIVSCKMVGNLLRLVDVCSISAQVSEVVMSLLRVSISERPISCGIFYSNFVSALNTPLYFSVEFHGKGNARYEMVFIPGGTFEMGALLMNRDAYDDESPSCRVTISRDMYVGKYPVTQGLYESVMDKNPSYFKGATRPVENVSWYDAVAFCNKLSELEGREKAYSINGTNVRCNFSAKGYRLLTEAEWEYCARSGENFKYSGSDNVDEVAWYDRNSGKETHPVGLKKPNGFGLYDMSGNVWEWCWDVYASYNITSKLDPRGVTIGSVRVFRGGSWDSRVRYVRVTNRSNYVPSFTSNRLGFRLGLTP